MRCEMCSRERKTTSHHLIPKQVHSKKWCKRMFSKEEMNKRRANLCSDCHPYLHKKFTHSTLAKFFNTIDKILGNEEIQKFVLWVSRQDKKAKR